MTYDKLLNTVIEYTGRQPIEDNDEVVSAYTLWKAIESEFGKIKYVVNENNDFLYSVNFLYRELFYKDPNRYFTVLKDVKVRTSMFKPLKFKNITSSINNGGNTIAISLWADGKNNEGRCINIYKDIDKDNYYGDDFVIESFKDELDNIVNTLKPYTKSSMTENQQITNDVFDININYPLDRDLSIDIKLNNSDYNIDKLINEQRDVILKNTKVDRKDLNNLCSNMVNNYLDKVNSKQKINVN